MDVTQGRQHRKTISTGKAAEMAGVAPRTIAKWFDRKEIAGYTLPLSKDRRIYLDLYVKFLADRGVSTEAIEVGYQGTWVRIEDAKPNDIGVYLVFAVDREGRRWRGCVGWHGDWSNGPEYWTPYITHWRRFPSDP